MLSVGRTVGHQDLAALHSYDKTSRLCVSSGEIIFPSMGYYEGLALQTPMIKMSSWGMRERNAK